MSTAPTITRTNVYMADPDRWDGRAKDVELLPATATASAMSEALDAAALLVVDDALAFPFESLRDVDRDIPLAVRLAAPLDAAGLEAVLAQDLLDHLTPLDVVAGPAGAWHTALARRGLPLSRYVGGGDLTVEQLVNRARQWRRRLDEAWRPRATPPGAPLDVVNMTVTAASGPQRLRHVKGRLRCERDLLRRELEVTVAQQPTTRDLTAAVFARRPEAWVSALPGPVAEWVAIPLVAGDETSPDLLDAQVRTVELPSHLRLDLPAADLDLAVVAADLLHSPVHAVERLFVEAIRLLRPGGSLVLLAEVVPDPGRDPAKRPAPLGAEEAVALVARASGRQVVLDDVRSYRRPGEDHHRGALFRWRHLGTARKESWWT